MPMKNSGSTCGISCFMEASEGGSNREDEEDAAVLFSGFLLVLTAATSWVLWRSWCSCCNFASGVVLTSSSDDRIGIGMRLLLLLPLLLLILVLDRAGMVRRRLCIRVPRLFSCHQNLCTAVVVAVPGVRKPRPAETAMGACRKRRAARTKRTEHVVDG